MKNMKIHSALTIAFFAYLATAACRLPQAPEPGSTAGTIVLSVGAQDGRTILPTKPLFEDFVLSFEGPAGANVPPEQTLKPGRTVSLQLAPGAWTIRARGYVLHGGARKAAAEGSAKVDVVAGKAIDVRIPVASIMAGAEKGTFEYALSSDGVPISGWSVRLEAYVKQDPNQAPLLNLAGGAPLSGSLECDPGYYLLTATAAAANGDIAVRTEIVHIASNLVSAARFAFASADFVSAVSVSGTVACNANGQALYITQLTLTETDGSIIETVYPDFDGRWTTRIATHAGGRQLRFSVRFGYNGAYLDRALPSTCTVADADINDLNLSLDLTLINLAGSLAFDGSPSYAPEYARIEAYPAKTPDPAARLGSASWSSGSDGSWTMPIDSRTSAAPLFFYVCWQSGYNRETGVWATADVDSYQDADIAGIRLTADPRIADGSMATISGALNLSANGNPISQARVDAFPITQVPNGDLNKQCVVENGRWYVTLPKQTADVRIGFDVSFIHNGIGVHRRLEQTAVIRDQDLTLDLALDARLVVLSGTLQAYVDGTPIDMGAHDAGINTELDYYRCDPQGRWKAVFDASPRPVPMSARIVIHPSSGSASTFSWSNESWTGPLYSDKDVDNIAIDLRFISASGTFRASVDGVPYPPEKAIILASFDPDCPNNFSIGRTQCSPDGSWRVLYLDPGSVRPGYFYAAVGDSQDLRGYVALPPKSQDIGLAPATGIAIEADLVSREVRGTLVRAGADLGQTPSAWRIAAVKSIDRIGGIFALSDPSPYFVGSAEVRSGSWRMRVLLPRGDEEGIQYLAYLQPAENYSPLPSMVRFTPGAYPNTQKTVDLDLDEMAPWGCSASGTAVVPSGSRMGIMAIASQDMAFENGSPLPRRKIDILNYSARPVESADEEWRLELPRRTGPYDAWFMAYDIAADGTARFYVTTSPVRVDGRDLTGIVLDPAAMRELMP